MDAMQKVREKIRANMPKDWIPLLTWTKVSPYCIQSEDKRFTIGKVTVLDQTHYECWFGRIPLAYRLATSDEAKTLCEAHARSIARNPPPSNAPISGADVARVQAVSR